MRPTLAEILCGAALVLGLLAGTVLGIDSCHKKDGGKAETQATELKGEANAHEKQAREKDTKISDLQAKLDGQQKELGRLADERCALLRKLAIERAKRVNPGVPVGPVEPVSDLRDEVIAKDAEVIAGQDKIIQGQTLFISTLTIARDEWKATAELRERQALAQEAATKAWKDAVTASRWSGRFEGAAAGALLGYLGRR